MLKHANISKVQTSSSSWRWTQNAEEIVPLFIIWMYLNAFNGSFCQSIPALMYKIKTQISHFQKLSAPVRHRGRFLLTCLRGFTIIHVYCYSVSTLILRAIYELNKTVHKEQKWYCCRHTVSTQSAVYFLEQAALLITARPATPGCSGTHDWQQPCRLIASSNSMTDSYLFESRLCTCTSVPEPEGHLVELCVAVRVYMAGTVLLRFQW